MKETLWTGEHCNILAFWPSVRNITRIQVTTILSIGLNLVQQPHYWLIQSTLLVDPVHTIGWYSPYYWLTPYTLFTDLTYNIGWFYPYCTCWGFPHICSTHRSCKSDQMVWYQRSSSCYVRSNRSAVRQPWDADEHWKHRQEMSDGMLDRNELLLCQLQILYKAVPTE